MKAQVACILAVLGFASCVNSPTPADGADGQTLDCHPGDELVAGDQKLCVYRKDLLIETGFRVRGEPSAAGDLFACPALVPHMHSYGVFVVCSPKTELGSDFYDAMKTQYGDEVDGGACTHVACLPGQTCVGGQCMIPGNDFDHADCTSLNSSDVAQGGDLAADSCYLVDSDLEVFGGPLVIEPGATLYFARDTGLSVREDGAIQAIGTIRRPVTFSAQEASRGYWRGIHIGPGTAESRLVRTVVEFAGSGPWNDAAFTDGRDRAAIVNGGGLLSLQDSLVRQSGYYAVTSAGTIGDFDGNLFDDDLRVASMTARNWSHVGDGNVFARDSETLLGVDGSIAGDGTERIVWQNLGAPYLIGDLVVAGAELQIAAGTRVRAADGGYLDVKPGAALTVQGTSEAPVRFSASHETPGAWRGIRVESDGTARGPSSLQFLEIAYGGALWGDGLDGDLTVIGSATIDGAILRASASSGLAVDGGSVTSVTCQALTLENNGDTDVVPATLTCSP